MEWVGKASGIDEDLKVAFGDDNDTANKCINIARYWVATNGETLHLYDKFKIKYPNYFDKQGDKLQAHSSLPKSPSDNEI